MTTDNDVRYVVVTNHEEQYSVWPLHRTMAPGWRNVGFEGTRSECLAHIESVWTDLRPLGIRGVAAQS